MISINSVYQLVEDNDNIRIIHIDREGDLCAFVYIERKLSMPIFDELSVIEKEYESNNIVEILDPYLTLKTDDKLSEIEIRKRDEAWNIIEKYWESRQNDILMKKTRMQVFQEIAEVERMPLMNVRRIFSRFWQRGMTRNALLPDYSKSGGKGKEKKAKEKKMGRHRIYGDNATGGIIITDVIKKQFEAAIKKYWRTSKKKSLRVVYRLMLSDFYSITVRNNKEMEKVILEFDNIPSFSQFYFWFKKNENTVEDIKSREGIKEYELKHRPILGSSTLEAPGPGFRFQIDATTADIYIVSEVDRSKNVGRPTIYIVIDVFSRMITGVYVGLESSSWNGAMMALDSMVADKVEFCKKYNIEIEKEDWPCFHVPVAIIADRGEMEGHGVRNLINNLKITVENTSPYRGDFKGIVERFFRTLNERIESFLPGAVMKDYRKRGDPDYRLEAKLTLKELTEIVIRVALLHNIKEIERYPLTPEMIRDEVSPTPLDLWNWGIANKKGTIRKIDRDRFRINILPKEKVEKATIKRGAIILNGRSYGASELLDGSFQKLIKRKSFDIVFDPRNIEHIYYIMEDGTNYITFNLLESNREYKDMFLEDIVFAKGKEGHLRQKAKRSQLQHEIELDQTMIKIAKNATKKTNEALDPTLSKTNRIKNIKLNRAEEKERNRREEAFKPEVIQKDTPTPVIQFPSVKPQVPLENEQRATDYDSRMMEKIRLRREKIKNDQKETE